MKTSEELSHAVIGAAMRVHSHFGSGYLEEVYKNALMVELKEAGIVAEKEVPIAVDYHGIRVGSYQADIIVEKVLIVELKAVSAIVTRHEAQLVNYLTATGINDGLLINFGASSLQFKHKYRLYRSLATNPVPSLGDNPARPLTQNPVNLVNPVEKPSPAGIDAMDRINRIDRIKRSVEPLTQNPVRPLSQNPVNLVNPVEKPSPVGIDAMDRINKIKMSGEQIKS